MNLNYQTTINNNFVQIGICTYRFVRILYEYSYAINHGLSKIQ